MLNINLHPNFDMSKFPLLMYLKEPVFNLSELYTRYPTGGNFGWFSFVNEEKTFAFWDTETSSWRLLGGGGGSVGGGLNILPGVATEEDLLNIYHPAKGSLSLVRDKSEYYQWDGTHWNASGLKVTDSSAAMSGGSTTTMKEMETRVAGTEIRIHALEADKADKRVTDKMQPLLTEEIIIKFKVTTTEALPVTPGQVLSGDIAIKGGVLYKYQRRSMTDFDWQRLDYKNIINGQPHPEYIYNYNGGRYLWTGSGMLLISESGNSGGGLPVSTDGVKHTTQAAEHPAYRQDGDTWINTQDGGKYTSIQGVWAEF